MDSVVQAVEHTLSSSPLLALPLAFVGGAMTGFNPCVYPTIPVIVGYICGRGGEGKARGLLLALIFVLGLAITYVLLGLTASFVGSVLGVSRTGWTYIVGGVCIVVGLVMSGIVPLKFATVAPMQSRWSRMSGFGGALALGMLFGLVASPCAMPILTLILAVVALKGQAVFGSLLLFSYAIGHGLPLVVIGAAAGAVTRLEQLTRYSAWMQKGGGALLVLVGIYFIWVA